MQEILPYVLEVDGQEVIVTPDPAHEFVATTEQVALGYGVSVEAIRSLKTRRGEELLEGKHWAVADRNTPGGVQALTLWTKRGIVRLGFFIRSKRARLFRDMAEDLVIAALEAPQSSTTPALLSARQIGEALGLKPKHAAVKASRAGILPTHHFFEPRCNAAAYLYPLDQVEAQWPRARFPIFQGQALPGTGPVAHVVKAIKDSKIARKHQPRLIPTDTDAEQLARRLLSLEAQKRDVLKQLAALA